MDDGADEPAPETLRRSSTPQAALPSFPLPTLPDAPAKSTLALQGLDKALLDAEIIDPARVVPIDAIDQDRHDSELHILSEKTKKRLGELGITEFFAGAFPCPCLAGCTIATDVSQCRLRCSHFSFRPNALRGPFTVLTTRREMSARLLQPGAERR